MINTKYAEQYCCEDISLIENYDEAIRSENVYDCHHRLEIELKIGRKEMIKRGLYWKRPASELIFIDHKEHQRIHNTADGSYRYIFVCPLRLVYLRFKLKMSQSEIAKELGIDRRTVSKKLLQLKRAGKLS